jgi:hypothetical protein
VSETKEVVEFDAALLAEVLFPGPPPKKRWSFIKTQCPAQKVRLKKEIVEFRVVRQRKGGYASHSEFSTGNEVLAGELREVQRRGKDYVFEKE